MFATMRDIKLPLRRMTKGRMIGNLGVHLSDNVTWNEHVNHIVKKGSKQLYAIRALKECGLTDRQLVLAYFRVCKSRLGWPHAILK